MDLPSSGEDLKAFIEPVETVLLWLALLITFGFVIAFIVHVLRDKD